MPTRLHLSARTDSAALFLESVLQVQQVKQTVAAPQVFALSLAAQDHLCRCLW